MLDKPGRVRWAFKSGFVAGIGFAVAAVGVFYVWELVSDMTGPKNIFSEKAGLVVVDHRLTKGQYDADVLGSIKNTGKQAWSLVNIRVELQDKEGKFLDTCSHRLDGVIRPEQTRNFKVSCYGSKEKPLVAFEKHSVTVDHAYIDKGR
jgi:hypothetical protein